MDQLGILAKYWESGKVKTRLASAIGPETASELYRGFLLASLDRFRDLADRRDLVFCPSDKEAEFRALASRSWCLQPQSDGDLGQRMHHFFANSFGETADRVVLIGADSPTLPVAYVDGAFDSLKHHAIVLGPSCDGGYYLVGASGMIPPIFSGVVWSSPRVWEQTIALLQAANITYATLPEWYDVDDIDDLKRLQRELTHSSDDQAYRNELLRLIRVGQVSNLPKSP